MYHHEIPPHLLRTGSMCRLSFVVGGPISLLEACYIRPRLIFRSGPLLILLLWTSFWRSVCLKYLHLLLPIQQSLGLVRVVYLKLVSFMYNYCAFCYRRVPGITAFCQLLILHRIRLEQRNSYGHFCSIDTHQKLYILQFRHASLLLLITAL